MILSKSIGNSRGTWVQLETTMNSATEMKAYKHNEFRHRTEHVQHFSGSGML
jgi:plasmid maintenance system antidote protein VapI